MRMTEMNDTRTGLIVALLGLGLLSACGDDPIIEAASGTGTGATETGEGETSGSGSETSTTDGMTGDGDGDPATGDGDGDPSGDGDGDPSGDGDGDPSGDGDGDPSGDGDGDMSGDGDGDASGDGDGDMSGDGDGDMDLCGNGQIDGGETCDDQNDDNSDGCLSNCMIATSCLDIILVDPEAEDGIYTISPKANAPWIAECDMSTDGGGWTAIELPHTCNGDLDSNIVEIDDATNFDVDDECRPYTRDLGGGHTYYWDIEFPPGFDSFYLDQYSLRANAGGIAQSDIDFEDFIQGDWNQAYGNNSGDVSFGSALEDGPETSFAAAGASFDCEACEQLFPELETIFELPALSSTLRIGWGEDGIEAEGWYPWYSGKIFIR